MGGTQDDLMVTELKDRLNLQEYAMKIAETAALRSEDPFHKVGACLIRPDHTIAAMGYNGAPSGVEIDWSDRDERRLWVIHAEANALRYVRPGEVYMMASTMMPCRECVLLAVSYGVREIVYRDELDPAVYDKAKVLEIAAACGVSIEREEA